MEICVGWNIPYFFVFLFFFFSLFFSFFFFFFWCSAPTIHGSVWTIIAPRAASGMCTASWEALIQQLWFFFFFFFFSWMNEFLLHILVPHTRYLQYICLLMCVLCLLCLMLSDAYRLTSSLKLNWINVSWKTKYPYHKICWSKRLGLALKFMMHLGGNKLYKFSAQNRIPSYCQYLQLMHFYYPSIYLMYRSDIFIRFTLKSILSYLLCKQHKYSWSWGNLNLV